MRIKQDKNSCVYLSSLREFKAYIEPTYIVGINLITNLFSAMTMIQDSIKMMTEAMSVLRTIKGKELLSKLSEEHLDKIVNLCLLRKDANEFDTEWAKKKMQKELPTPLMITVMGMTQPRYIGTRVENLVEI